MTAIGEFDTLVEFQRATIVRSPLGVEQPGEWAETEKAWSKVLYGTGAERRQAAAEGASQTATFRVASTAKLRGVIEQDRILMKGAGWGITSIAPIGVNDEIEFTATTAKG